MIVPLLFIPLIENAFKHGVSSTQESFINIKLELQENNRINCLVENSNYPKKITTGVVPWYRVNELKTPSGITLSGKIYL